MTRSEEATGMRVMKILSAGLLTLLAGTVALAQIPPSTPYSTPEVPSDAVLRRLNLQKAWARHVPMEGRRDGFVSIQHAGRDLLILTRSGLVLRMGAED